MGGSRPVIGQHTQQVTMLAAGSLLLLAVLGAHHASAADVELAAADFFQTVSVDQELDLDLQELESSDQSEFASVRAAPQPNRTAGGWTVSKKGRGLAKFCVGYSQKARRDHTGELVIGFRHKKNVRVGQTIESPEAYRFLDQDIKAAEGVVKRLVTSPLQQREYEALVSYVFSTNEASFKRSKLLRYVNSGQLERVPGELKKLTVQLPNRNIVDLKERTGCRDSRVTYWKKASQSPRKPRRNRGGMRSNRRKKYGARAAGRSAARRRTTSTRGLRLVKSFSGLRLLAYLDATGAPTIGYGHTAEVYMGQWITVQQAEMFLKADLRTAEDAVSTLVKVPLTQNQFDALVSFTFNLGQGTLRRSTLLRELNAGRKDRVPAEMERFTKAGGRTVAGLVKRRIAEVRLWRGTR